MAPLVLQCASVTEELQKRRQRFMDGIGLAQMIQDSQPESVITRPPRTRRSASVPLHGVPLLLRMAIEDLCANMIMMRKYLGDTVRFSVVLYDPEYVGSPHSREQFNEVKQDFLDTKQFLLDNYDDSCGVGAWLCTTKYKFRCFSSQPYFPIFLFDSPTLSGIFL